MLDDDADDNGDIYIMMKFLSVCLSRKMSTFLKGLSVSLGFMVFHGFWLVFMIFQGGFMFFHGFWLVSMVFQGGVMVFHCFWLVSMVFQSIFKSELSAAGAK